MISLKRLRARGVAAWSVPYDAAVRHIGLLEDRLFKVLKELKQL